MTDEAQAKLAVALKWLDKIGSFAGERQRSGTIEEDHYLHGVHDADTAARKLVDLAKEEIKRTIVAASTKETVDNGCTVQQAALLGWDKDQRVLAYRGRTIDTIQQSGIPGSYRVEYDCDQTDLLLGWLALDIMVPLEVVKRIEDNPAANRNTAK